MYWWYHYWWFPSPFWAVIMWIIGIAVIALVVWIIARALQSFVSRENSRSYSEAERILDERFARGEISEEEYLRMKKVLRKR
ncbi:MAG: hypothetical protein DRP27_02475 [Thermotogae bacterium]|nr:SHOCT domain-containing protein [Thermotogota bacterium]RKX46051.1 MAG: hypothetical protein DRP27_02475 [Thermotogota bacterium]